MITERKLSIKLEGTVSDTPVYDGAFRIPFHVDSIEFIDSLVIFEGAEEKYRKNLSENISSIKHFYPLPIFRGDKLRVYGDEIDMYSHTPRIIELLDEQNQVRVVYRKEE